jgi:hypothetical protein
MDNSKTEAEMILISMSFHDGFKRHHRGLNGPYENEQEAINDLLTYGYVKESGHGEDYFKKCSPPFDHQTYIASMFDTSKLKKISY